MIPPFPGQPIASRSLDQPIASRLLDQPIASRSLDQPIASRLLDQPMASRLLDQPMASRLLGRFRVLLIIPLLGFALGGCRGDGSSEDMGYEFKVGISPTPPTVGAARLIISLHDPDGAPVEGARVLVEGNMSHAGMTPVVDSAQAEAPGQYSVSAFSFSMAGDWVLDLTALLPDGTAVRTRHPTSVVGPVGGGG